MPTSNWKLYLFSCSVGRFSFAQRIRDLIPNSDTYLIHCMEWKQFESVWKSWNAASEYFILFSPEYLLFPGLSMFVLIIGYCLAFGLAFPRALTVLATWKAFFNQSHVGHRIYIQKYKHIPKCIQKDFFFLYYRHIFVFDCYYRKRRRNQWPIVVVQAEAPRR